MGKATSRFVQEQPAMNYGLQYSVRVV